VITSRHSLLGRSCLAFKIVWKLLSSYAQWIFFGHGITLRRVGTVVSAFNQLSRPSIVGAHGLTAFGCISLLPQLRDGLVHEADDQAIGAALETRELAKERRRHNVVDIIEIPVVGQIDRIDSQAKLVLALMAHEREAHRKVPIDLSIQREKSREALSIRRSNVIVQHIQIGIRKARMHVYDGTECKRPGKVNNAPDAVDCQLSTACYSYSVLSARIGSIVAARHAGTTQAAIATSSNSIAEANSVTGSRELPFTHDATNPFSATLNPSPIARPKPSIVPVDASTSRMMLVLGAPNAMRIPTSCVRCVTANDTTLYSPVAASANASTANSENSVAINLSRPQPCVSSHHSNVCVLPTTISGFNCRSRSLIDRSVASVSPVARTSSDSSVGCTKLFGKKIANRSFLFARVAIQTGSQEIVKAVVPTFGNRLNVV